MSEPRFVTTGPVGGSPNRLEINDFVKKEKFFSLYIQALQIISKQDQNNIQSFFQLGGIHGLPYIPWDGVVGNPPFKDPSDANWGGYCTHASVLFPTWHRPYVMLYEQILQQRAIEIAATYHTVDKEAWKQAALDLRQPFWDWAKNAVPPDEVIALKQVTIVGPDGKHVTVDNPLYHYAFHPLDPSYEFPTPFSGWQTTLRHPTSQEPDASDDVTALRNVLYAAQTNITTNTYNMLTRISTWPAFSNDTVGDDGSTSNSVEAIHNNIHFNVGGVPAGHMGNAAVAGFDPIFYLHHANVDRLLSLWSALHPGVWVSPGSSEKGTFTIPPGVTIDQTTVLTPFWNSQTTFWASSAVENTSKLGYTYPDFNGLDLGNTDAVRTAIGNRVNQLYGTSISGLLAAAIPAAKESSLPAQVINPLRGLVTQIVAQTQSIIQSILPPNLGLWDWTARIQFKKFEVGTSFAVLLFLGHVPENSEEWRVSRNYVGAHYAFVNSAAERCANCLNQQDVVIEGFVHLNLAIALLSGLGSLIPEVIKPYLTEFLHWRILRSDGAVVELKSLEVSVFATPLSYPSGAIFPVPGVASRIDDITHGKIGGLSLPI